MIEKTVNRLTATRLRLVLIGSLVLITIIIAGGFYASYSYLRQFAVDVSHTAENASTSDSDIITFQKLEQKLTDSSDSIDKTRKIVADSSSYQYQDQIITDLNTYAKRADISISAYSFGGNETGGAAAPAATAPAGAAAPAPIAGLKSVKISVTLLPPIKYKNLMNFVHSIEQNLTKMQIANLTITKSEKDDEVTLSELSIEVYVK